eukprot:8808286-Lingulodinium_polyedra.AAC.1
MRGFMRVLSAQPWYCICNFTVWLYNKSPFPSAQRVRESYNVTNSSYNLCNSALLSGFRNTGLVAII